MKLILSLCVCLHPIIISLGYSLLLFFSFFFLLHYIVKVAHNDEPKAGANHLWHCFISILTDWLRTPWRKDGTRKGQSNLSFVMESQEKYIKRDVDDGTSILSVYTRVLRTDTKIDSLFHRELLHDEQNKSRSNISLSFAWKHGWKIILSHRFIIWCNIIRAPGMSPKCMYFWKIIVCDSVGCHATWRLTVYTRR